MKKYFSLAMLFCFLCFMTAAQELVYHSFENGSLLDQSGNGHNCQVFGAVPTEDQYGVENGAYQFDGIDDYLIIPDDPELRGGASDFSFNLWFQPDDDDIYLPLIGKYFDAFDKDWAIRADNYKLLFTAEIGGEDPACISEDSITANKWIRPQSQKDELIF